jgi:hypothetical protein
MYHLTTQELRAFAIIMKYHSLNLQSTNTNVMKDKSIPKDYIDSILYECIGIKKRIKK